MFRVTIMEDVKETSGYDSVCVKEIKRYEQAVDVLDLAAVMAAVNRKPRKPRTKKGAVPE